MSYRTFLLLLSTASLAAQTTNAPPTASAAATQMSSGEKSTIRFEDASAKAGINYTHSFGSAKLGSLLEGTGAGCAWIDYNNSGRPSLFVVNGRPLDDAMHPYP